MLDRICFSLSFQGLLALTRQAMQAYLLCKPLSFSNAEAMAPWGVGASARLGRSLAAEVAVARAARGARVPQHA